MTVRIPNELLSTFTDSEHGKHEKYSACVTYAVYRWTMLHIGLITPLWGVSLHSLYRAINNIFETRTALYVRYYAIWLANTI